MIAQPATLSIAISPRVRPVLESMAGETPDQKITNLLLSELRRNLEACDKEFGYDLEMDAMRWQDLIAERKHWFKQLSQPGIFIPWEPPTSTSPVTNRRPKWQLLRCFPCVS